MNQMPPGGSGFPLLLFAQRDNWGGGGQIRRFSENS